MRRIACGLVYKSNANGILLDIFCNVNHLLHNFILGDSRSFSFFSQMGFNSGKCGIFVGQYNGIVFCISIRFYQCGWFAVGASKQKKFIMDRNGNCDEHPFLGFL